MDGLRKKRLQVGSKMKPRIELSTRLSAKGKEVLPKAIRDAAGGVPASKSRRRKTARSYAQSRSCAGSREPAGVHGVTRPRDPWPRWMRPQSASPRPRGLSQRTTSLVPNRPPRVFGVQPVVWRGGEVSLGRSFSSDADGGECALFLLNFLLDSSGRALGSAVLRVPFSSRRLRCSALG